MDDRRNKAARYILNSRNLFFNNKSISMALASLERAFKLLNENEITSTMHAWYLLLLILSEKDYIPEFYNDYFAESEYYFYLHLILTHKNKGITAMTLSISLREKKIPQRNKGFFSDFLSAYVSAKALYESGDIESAFAIITKLIKSIERYKGIYYTNLKALCLSLLGDYYNKKNKLNISKQIMKKAFELIEANPLYFISAKVYLQIAAFYASNFGIKSSSKMLDKALEISNLYVSEKLLIPMLKQLQYNSLYKGEIKELKKHLKYSRSLCERLKDNLGFAWNYILEGDFYIYNKEIDKALECFKNAYKLSDDEDLVSAYFRHTLMGLMYNNEWERVDEFLAKYDGKYSEYCFNNVIDIYLAEGKEEVEKNFKKYIEMTGAWREEMAIMFVAKLSEYIPEEFEEYLKELIDLHQKDDETLGLACVYEASAKYYKNVGNKENEIKMLRKAIDTYKKIGCDKAARELAKKFRFNPEKYQILFNKIDEFIVDNGNEILKSEFRDFKMIQAQNLMEQEAMKDIVDFINSSVMQNDLNGVLNEILKWFVSFVKTETAYLVVYRDKNMIIDSCCITEEESEPCFDDMAFEKKSVINGDKLEIIYDYFIDDNNTLRLYLGNENLTLSKYEFDKISIILNDIDPVIRLLLRNAINYKSSIFDPLTGLYTRWYYEERFKEEFEKSRRYRLPMSYILCDIDHFKNINDSFGHVIGDEVLKELGKLFKEQTRKFDIVSRYGGEEFSIVLPNTTSGQAFRVSEKIRKIVSSINSFPFGVTMSFGVTGTDIEDYENMIDMVDASDKALYMAKNSGRNLSIVANTFMDKYHHSFFQ